MYDEDATDVVATLTRYRPQDGHFDDEWPPATRLDALADILINTSPGRTKQRGTTKVRRRARIVVLAATVAATAGIVAVVVPAGSPGGRESAAAATLERLGAVAGAQGGTVGAGQFAYVKTVSEQSLASGQPLVPVDVLRTWTSPNGAMWTYEVAGSGPPCLAGGHPDPADLAGGQYEGLDAAQLASLPTDIDQLAAYLDTHPAGDNRGARNRFLDAEDLLRSGLAPPALRSAVLGVLAQTSGIQVTSDSTDAAGRPAVQVDLPYKYGVESLYFDPATSRVLEQQTTQTSRGSDVGQDVVKESKVVDSVPSDLPRCPRPTVPPG